MNTSVNQIRAVLGLGPAVPMGDRVIHWHFRSRLRGWRRGDVREPIEVVTGRRFTQGEAMDDLLALWAYGLHPESVTLGARWNWHAGEVAALKRVAEGLCDSIPL